MKRLAIIGSGIAGLACVFFLHQKYDITVFEKNSYLGGHTNTVNVLEGNLSVPVDTGFMVFNKKNYPNLLRFFQELDIEYQPTDMSFSVNHIEEDVQWNGAGLMNLFSQRKNLLRPRFYRLLSNMSRFCKEAEKDVDNLAFSQVTIQEYSSIKNYHQDFLDLFLLPMSGAIWSTSSDNMLKFPIQTLLRFFINHGFLGLDTHYQWYTVKRGAKVYIDTLKKVAKFTHRVGTPVKSITSDFSDGSQPKVTLVLENGEEEFFDYAIVASHADETLAMLGNPTELEKRLLTPFNYERNETLLHTDENVMPSIKRTWAAWNYRVDKEPVSDALRHSTHYWMNRLQSLNVKKNYFVSLNASHCVDGEKVIKKIIYEHPTFSLQAIEAQKSLFKINEQKANQNIFFCGSYFKYGFHEDAFTSALNVCKELTGEELWAS